jgi:hypothetical protein
MLLRRPKLSTRRRRRRKRRRRRRRRRRRMRWAGHAGCMNERRGAYWLFGGKSGGQKGHLEEVRANWRIIT